MEKAYRNCKMCGKKYEYCHTDRPGTIYRWQDVGCCREHGMLYFTKVKISRGQEVSQEELDDLNAYFEEAGENKVATADGIFDKPEHTAMSISEFEALDSEPSDEDWDEDLYDDDDEEDDDDWEDE